MALARGEGVTAKLHMRAPEGAEHRTLCGTSAVNVVETRGLVTCLICKRHLESIPDEAAWSWRRVIEYVADVIGGPAVEPYPVAIVADEWRLMSCRMHAAEVQQCACTWCAWERRNRQRVDVWAESNATRPHRRHDFPFGSLAAALSFYARWRRDGASLRSSTGNAGSRLEAVARLGAEVQTTQRFDRDSLEVERAGQACDIEAAVSVALSDEQRRRGLSIEDAYDVLLASTDESLGDSAHPAALAERTGITERAMRQLLAATRRALTVDLAARGLIPEPREQVGLGREIARRRAEMERAA
jgi:hypothetical protein